MYKTTMEVVRHLSPARNQGLHALFLCFMLCERNIKFSGPCGYAGCNCHVTHGRLPPSCACSEPEAQTVLQLARDLKPHVWLNVHSGMEAMFTPWDHKPEVGHT